ncbi:MAG: HEAT repeat domain-containing protein, partial [Methanobacteriaceae archaeon]|nr:HEAT repeat domain-containing protein [Methanobacteriaceae archaeon]
AWALGNIGDERAVEPLKEALNDKSGYVRKVAENYLKKF